VSQDPDRVLYISYDGLMEPLGQSQVLQYLKKLAKNYEIFLLTFEKKSDWSDVSKRETLINDVCQSGIRWAPLRYHKRPSLLATSYDLAVGLFVSLFLVLKNKIRIIHARSYVPSVLGLILKKILGTHFIFDMRGFWADERVDAGMWKRDSSLYKLAKWFEKHFLVSADVIVSLSEAGVDAMKAFPYLCNHPLHFEVIPTCANFEFFYPRSIASEGKNKPFVLGYVGAVTGWYLFDPVLECFKILLKIKPNALLKVLNRGEHRYIQQRLVAHKVPTSSVNVLTVDYAEVAAEMRLMEAGIFFIRPAFSKKASCPTKLGEFLGCGIPCLSNVEVGDTEKILNGESVGVILREFCMPAQEEAVKRLVTLATDPAVKDRCVEVALRYFSLYNGVRLYSRIYESLAD